MVHLISDAIALLRPSLEHNLFLSHCGIASVRLHVTCDICVISAGPYATFLPLCLYVPRSPIFRLPNTLSSGLYPLPPPPRAARRSASSSLTARYLVHMQCVCNHASVFLVLLYISNLPYIFYPPCVQYNSSATPAPRADVGNGEGKIG